MRGETPVLGKLASANLCQECIFAWRHPQCKALICTLGHIKPYDTLQGCRYVRYLKARASPEEK